MKKNKSPLSALTASLALAFGSGSAEAADRNTVSNTQPAGAVPARPASESVVEMGAVEVIDRIEGDAAAVVIQNGSPNVKTVVAIDGNGILPHDNLAEAILRAPGAAPNYNEFGDIIGIYTRGTSYFLNSVAIDGSKVVSSGDLSRDFRLIEVPPQLFDRIEIIKAIEPDTPGDSLGGVINLRTRSAFELTQPQEFNYRIVAKWAPSFLDQVQMRGEHPLHESISFGLRRRVELGGERRLGITVNGVYSEDASGYASVIQDFQRTTASPAYMFDYQTRDHYGVNSNHGVTGKIEYRSGPGDLYYFSALLNEYRGGNGQLRLARATSPQTLAVLNAAGLPTSGGAIYPTYTDFYTRVRPSSTSFQSQTQTQDFHSYLREFLLAGRNRRGPWAADYNLNYSFVRAWLDDRFDQPSRNSGGVFFMTARNIGWQVDRSRSLDRPTFTQLEGPSVYDIASYREGTLQVRNDQRRNSIGGGALNLRYDGAERPGTFLKAGGQWTRQGVGGRYLRRQFAYAGPDGVAGVGTNEAGFSRFQIANAKTVAGHLDGQVPFVLPSAAEEDVKANPRNWIEDRYYHESNKLIGDRGASERVAAAYAMGSLRWRNLDVAGGVRYEETRITTEGYVRRFSLASMTDAAARAKAEYGAKQTIRGRYDDFFPSIHALYRVAPQWQIRTSYAEGIGRPAFSVLVPSETANTTLQTVTVSNPGLRPQRARNIDLGLEYYFKPAGFVNIGVFRKDIRDYIFTSSMGTVARGTNNGFEGQYQGYELLTRSNGGSARIQGVEASYQQRFASLPGPWSGLAVSVNYTHLTASGNYDTPVGEVRSTSELAEFIPDTANAGLTFSYRKVTCRLSTTYTSNYLYSYSASPWLLRYREARETLNAGVTFALRPSVALHFDIFNALNAPQSFYKYASSRKDTYIVNSAMINVGVSGRF